MREDKSQAIALRKSGLSYLQINKKLGIAKSTLSFWLKDIEVPKRLLVKINNRASKASREALIKRNKLQTKLAEQRAEKIKVQARNEAIKLLKKPLFISGVMLYWAEGYKRGDKGSRWKSFDFANSDPEMIILMLRFIKRYLSDYFDKINIQVIGHIGMDINKTISYWSKLTKIEKSRFYKVSIYNNSSNKHKRNKKQLPYGTIHIRINDVRVFFQMIGWIDTAKKIK